MDKKPEKPIPMEDKIEQVVSMLCDNINDRTSPDAVLKHSQSILNLVNARNSLFV